MKNSKTSPKRLLSLFLAVIMCAACISYLGTTKARAASVELTFDSSSMMSYFSISNNLNVSYSEAESSIMMNVTGGDPWVLLNVEGIQTLSADTYKYVVVTYRTPTTNATTAATELFMCAGAIAAPTANYSVLFNTTKGYKYRSEIIDMSAQTYWTGTIHSIRFDAFTNASNWDTFYLASVTFCSDAASANAAAEAKAAEATGDLDL